LTRKVADGLLVLTLNPATLGDQDQAAARLRQVIPEVRRARGVVFDLRRHGPWLERDPAVLPLAFQASGLNQVLQFARLEAPGQRSRIYSGLPAGAPGGSAFYHHACYVRAGTVLEPHAGAEAKPVVFLVDESSLLPPIAAALLAAGRARLVAQGGLSDASLVDTSRIELPGGLRVSIRVSELVYADGSTGLAPELTLPGEGSQQALESAIELAREPAKAPPRQRLKLPACAAPPADRAYADAPYPSRELRLLAAFRIWAAVRYFFAYRDLMEHDWERALDEALASLIEAADARAYALALARMIAHLGDSHAEVTSPALAEYFGLASPPIRTRMIEGLPVVTQLLDPYEARKAGVSAGDVVLEVDGEPAGARIERLGRYLSASTPQSLAQLVMQRWLNGRPGSVVVLKLRDGEGRIREGRLRRAVSFVQKPWRSGPVLAMLPGNVGYADLERLAPEQVNHMFDLFQHTRAIVFDLRGYPRGTGWLVAARLSATRSRAAARFRRPLVLFPAARMGDVETLGAGWDFLQYLPESELWKYQGETVALIDERAMSQAEHAAMFLRAANGTRFVGSPTAGANGDVTRFSVPGGALISFSGQEIRWPDGAQLQRVGVIPDVAVKPSLRGIREGRDEVLEKALGYLGVRNVSVRGVGEAR